MGPALDWCKMESQGAYDDLALTNFEAHSLVLVRGPLRYFMRCWHCDLKVPMGWRWEQLNQAVADEQFIYMNLNRTVNTFLLKVR